MIGSIIDRVHLFKLFLLVLLELWIIDSILPAADLLILLY